MQSLRRLADTAVGVVQVRLELFGTELEQEKQRLFDALLRAALGLLLLGLALVLAIAFVVLLFQEGYRLPAIGVLTLIFGGIGAWLLQTFGIRLIFTLEGAIIAATVVASARVSPSAVSMGTMCTMIEAPIRACRNMARPMRWRMVLRRASRTVRPPGSSRG